MAFSDYNLISEFWTQAQAEAAIQKNKAALKQLINQPFPKHIRKRVFDMLVAAGSIKNAGGYVTIAKRCGCTVAQAQEMCEQIMGYSTEMDTEGKLD